MNEEYTNMGIKTVENTVSFRWGTWLIYLMLCVHLFDMVFFGIAEVPPLIAFNLIGIVFYFIQFRIIKISPSVFLMLNLLERMAAMVVATVYCGWSLGFQLYIFTIVAIVFFCNHVIRNDGFHTIYPHAFVITALLCFLGSRMYCLHHKPYFMVKTEFADIMYNVNSFITLGGILFFTYLYANRILNIESSLVENAEMDELTGLPNRHYLDRIGEELRLGMPGGTKEYAVAICDIDNFKHVNDRFGHLAGDYVLQKLAEILKRLYSSDVKVARWGGEEFLVVVHCEDAYDTCMAIMEEVREEFESLVIHFEMWQIRVTISIGVADTLKGMNFKDLTEEADKCLYHAKGNGKNQVVGKRWLDEIHE